MAPDAGAARARCRAKSPVAQPPTARPGAAGASRRRWRTWRAGGRARGWARPSATRWRSRRAWRTARRTPSSSTSGRPPCARAPGGHAPQRAACSALGVAQHRCERDLGRPAQCMQAQPGVGLCLAVVSRHRRARRDQCLALCMRRLLRGRRGGAQLAAADAGQWHVLCGRVPADVVL